MATKAKVYSPTDRLVMGVVGAISVVLGFTWLMCGIFGCAAFLAWIFGVSEQNSPILGICAFFGTALWIFFATWIFGIGERPPLAPKKHRS